MNSPLRLQDLPPGCAHLCLEAERFVLGEVGLALSGRSLLVAFSGGLDSTVLLTVAACLARKNGGRIIAAHFNHRLRPEADDEAARALDVCNDMGLPCLTGSGNVARYARRMNLGVEEAGRILRYRFLLGILHKTGTDYLLTAHHLDDLAEDVLMRLTRGTGWPELAGMPAWDPERRLLRPLLLIPRHRLHEFAGCMGLQWTEDSSNYDRSFRRNRFRLELMPAILGESPNFPAAAARLWRLARIDREYWDSLVAQEVELGSRPEANGVVHLPAARLRRAPKALRLRLYKRSLELLGPGQPLADSLLRLDDAFARGRAGALVQFPGAKTALVSGDGVTFRAAGQLG